MWLLMLVLVGQPDVQPTELRTLETAERVERAKGRKLLGRVVNRLREDTKLSSQEREELLMQLARLIPLKAQTASEVLEIMGPDAVHTVARQLFSRRTLEQWRFEHPDRLVLIFESFLGQEQRLVRVQVIPGL